MNWCWTVEGQHGRIMELHGASIHFFLAAPFSSTVLEPDLGDNSSHEPHFYYYYFFIHLNLCVCLAGLIFHTNVKKVILFHFSK